MNVDLSAIIEWAVIASFVAFIARKSKGASQFTIISFPLSTTIYFSAFAVLSLVLPETIVTASILIAGAGFIGFRQIKAVQGLTGAAIGAGAGVLVVVLTSTMPRIVMELLSMGLGCSALVLLFHARVPVFDGSTPASRSKAGGGGKLPTKGLKVADDVTHGSASWGSVAVASQFGHFKPAGFVLGRLNGSPFRYEGHVLTCAPTGAGKGVGAVIPNLLGYPGSALVLDIKGENFAVTARHRREMGQGVYVIDPFGVTGAIGNACNWLDRLDPDSPDCVGESAALADCLVIPSANHEDSHFDETAKGLLQGLMLHVAGLEDPARRTLGEVRAILTGPGFVELLQQIAEDQGYAFGLPARAAQTLLDTGDRERGSILSTARRSTAFLDDPRVAACLSRSDFNLGDLKTEAVTVYIVVPPAKLAANSRLMRGFIGSALAALTKDTRTPAHKVGFFLDEFAQLGRMTMIEDALSLVRGYGVAFWIFVQDISQLKGVYKKWQTFTANTAKVFFGTADVDTAKYISESLGKLTISYNTKGSSTGYSGHGFNAGSSGNEHMTGRDLLTPDEVIRLGPSRPIAIIGGEPPYLLNRLNYLEDADFSGMADPNPYHLGK